MSALKRDEYLSRRRMYTPERITLVIIAESPPASGRYFYNPAGAVSEPLFAALMLQLRYLPTTKEDGLRTFQQRGWLLIDATYKPVNELDPKHRDKVIAEDYQLLLEDLASVITGRSFPLVLVKANVCRILEPKLVEDGYNVLNYGRLIYFPSHGRQKDFQQQFGTVLRLAGQSPFAGNPKKG